jgi:hypothetical protein
MQNGMERKRNKLNGHCCSAGKGRMADRMAGRMAGEQAINGRMAGKEDGRLTRMQPRVMVE